MTCLWMLLTLVAGALCTGQWEEGDVNDPLLHTLLEEVYFPSSHLTREQVDLVSVETQVVSGMNYRATFSVGGATCHVIIYHQAWTNRTEISEDTCQDVTVPLPGGWIPGDPEDPVLLGLLEEVYYPNSAVNSEDLDLFAVESQTVSGVNHRMHFTVMGTTDTCMIFFFVQVWTNTSVVISDTCEELVVSHSDDSIPIPGGWQKSDVNHPMFQELLVEVYYPSTQVTEGDLELLTVQTQAVAGFNHKMTFHVMDTTETCIVIFFVQEWTNTTDITSDTCEGIVVRHRNDEGPMPGGWYESDVEDPMFQELLVEVYYPSTQVTEGDLELVSVRSQTVAGFNHQLTFNVVDTTDTCIIVFFVQQWTSTREVTSDTCEDLVMNHRDNQQPPVLGGWYESDVEDPIFQELLREVYYPTTQVTEGDLDLVSVLSQTVAGFNHQLSFNVVGTIDTCIVVFFVQEWTSTREVTSDTCEDFVVNHRENQQPPVLGGWHESDVEDPIFQELLREVYYPTTQVIEGDLDLVSVQSQTVAGFNHQLTFNVVDTIETCIVVFFVQEWTNTTEITSDTCEDLVVSHRDNDGPPMAGGWYDSDVEDPMFQELLVEVYYPSTQVSEGDLDLVAVQSQVVAGSNYKMTFTVVGTPDTCTVVIFVQPWTNTTEITRDSCESMVLGHTDDSTHMGGGWQETELDDPVLQQLLVEVYYPSTQVSEGDLEPVSAQQQVVAGMNYKITFNVVASSQQCYVIFFTQVWTNTTEITEDACESAVLGSYTPVPGGWQPVDMADADSNALLEEFYFPSTDLDTEDLLLVAVETQLVAGRNFRYTFQRSDSGAECQVIIFDKPWNRITEVTSDTCSVTPEPGSN